uniref:Choline/carnitine acyltransferase domain-containing protein n=1 Tax=Pundamilia nyererei TaxID=303518 RepID=A0A3B4EXD7_9CICH
CNKNYSHCVVQPLLLPKCLILVRGRYLNHQKGHPRVPVPPLRKICEGYLGALDPIIEEYELKQAKQMVETFMKGGGVGEELQRNLVRKACNTDNWVSSFTATKREIQVAVSGHRELTDNERKYGNSNS